MKNKNLLRLIVLCLSAVVLLAALTQFSVADFGDFSGSSDYGDSGWDDWGDSDWGDSDGTIMGGIPLPDWVVVALIIGFIILMLYARYKQKHATPNNPDGGAKPTDQSLLTPMEKFAEIDPDFSPEAFKEKISNLYVQFQNHWTAKNMEPMRGNMTDAFYNQIMRQMQPLIDQHQTNKVEHIAVLDVTLRGFMQDETNDIIVANVKTRIIDYYVDDNTGKIVRGSNTIERFMTYEWSMIRKKGMTTKKAADGTVTVNCPNCGAPVNINQSAQCEYCGSILTNAEYDWVLSGIKGISQVSSR